MDNLFVKAIYQNCYNFGIYMYYYEILYHLVDTLLSRSSKSSGKNIDHNDDNHQDSNSSIVPDMRISNMMADTLRMAYLTHF